MRHEPPSSCGGFGTATRSRDIYGADGGNAQTPEHEVTRRHLTRRQALTVIATGVAVLGPAVVLAQPAWPSRTVRIIVPFPPGGPADGSARALADAMAPRLGLAMVVENRPGAGGIVGITAAAQSNDGHTLLMGSTSMTITPSLRSPKRPSVIVAFL